MPVATVYNGIITRPEETVEYMGDLLKAAAPELGLETIGLYDVELIPRYPAVVIIPNQFTKEVHGTHTYIHGLNVEIYVLHSDLTKDKRTRSLEDCLLATRIIDKLEEDRTFGQRIIFSCVTRDQFAALPPRGNKSEAIISTRLTWLGTSESRFK